MNNDQKRKLAKAKKPRQEINLAMIDRQDIVELHNKFADIQQTITELMADQKFVEALGQNQKAIKVLETTLIALMGKIESSASLPEDVQKTVAETIKSNLPKIPAFPNKLEVANPTVIPDWLNNKTELAQLNKTMADMNAALEASLTPAQQPEKFIPYRRVIRVGNRLKFDDSTGGNYASGGGAASSGGSVGAATGSPVPADAFYQGVNSQTALPTAATAGDLTGATADKFGRQVVVPGTIRDLVGTQTTTISASTAETTIVTAAANTFNDLTLLIISNTSGTAARLDFRDTTSGSVLFSLYVPAGDTRGFAPQRPIPQTSVNTNWTAQSSASVTDLRVYAVFDKNK